MKNTLRNNSNTVLELFRGRCCLNPVHLATEIHHIIPRSICFGDPDKIENLAPLCTECHDKIHREGTLKYRDILRKAHETIK